MRKHIGSLILVAALFGATSSLFAANDYTGIVNPDGSIAVGGFSTFTTLIQGAFNSYNDTETGPSIITGNVGIGGHANFSMSDGQINGDVYMNSYGTFTTSGPAAISGHLHGHTSSTARNTSNQGFDGVAQDTTLNNAIAAAMNLSTQAGALAGTSNYAVTQGSWSQGQGIAISNPANNITINGAMNNPFNQPIVLNISSINNSNGAFTLAGNANTTFVINIAGNFTLNNSSITLTGGLLASNVLWNLTGGNKASVNLQQGTSVTGVFLAPNVNVTLSGGRIYGRLVANQLTLTSGGQVISQ